VNGSSSHEVGCGFIRFLCGEAPGWCVFVGWIDFARVWQANREVGVHGRAICPVDAFPG